MSRQDTEIPAAGAVEGGAPLDVPARRPGRWRWVRRIGLAAVAAVVVLGLVAAGLVVWSVRRTFPDYEGTVTVAGLAGP